MDQDTKKLIASAGLMVGGIILFVVTVKHDRKQEAARKKRMEDNKATVQACHDILDRIESKIRKAQEDVKFWSQVTTDFPDN